MKLEDHLIIDDAEPSLPSLGEQIISDVKLALQSDDLEKLRDLLKRGFNNYEYIARKALKYKVSVKMANYIIGLRASCLASRFALMVLNNQTLMVFGFLSCLDRSRINILARGYEIAIENDYDIIVKSIRSMGFINPNCILKGFMAKATRTKNYQPFIDLLSKATSEVLNWTELLQTSYDYGDEELIIQILPLCKDISYNRILIRAIAKGMKRVTRLLVKQDVDLDMGLRAAIEYSRFDLIPLFIDLGASDWNSFFYPAGLVGSMKLIKFCLDKGGDKLDEALYGAAEGGKIELVKNLIIMGAPVNETTFTHAITSDNPIMIELLAPYATQHQLYNYISKELKHGFIENIMAVESLATDIDWTSFNDQEINGQVEDKLIFLQRKTAKRLKTS